MRLEFCFPRVVLLELDPLPGAWCHLPGSAPGESDLREVISSTCSSLYQLQLCVHEEGKRERGSFRKLAVGVFDVHFERDRASFGPGT